MPAIFLNMVPMHLSFVIVHTGKTVQLAAELGMVATGWFESEPDLDLGAVYLALVAFGLDFVGAYQLMVLAELLYLY
jgi:hypothetical protein